MCAFANFERPVIRQHVRGGLTLSAVELMLHRTITPLLSLVIDDLVN
jgi:hypothetical protein